MPKIKRKWLKWLLIGSGLAVLLPLAAIGAVFLLLVAVFRSAPEGAEFGIIGPNCPGVMVTISGELRDANNHPISGMEIHMRRASYGSDNDMELRFTSDDEGRFASDNLHSVSICDDLIFDAPARDYGIYEGRYEGVQIHYALADNYTEETFPRQPVPIRLIITLVEKLEVTGEPDEAP